MLRYFRFLFSILFVVGFASSAHADLSEESPYIPSILIAETDEEVSELEARGVIIWHRRGGMVLCAVPRQQASGLMAKGNRHRVQPRPRRAVPSLDQARNYSGADLVHAGGLMSRPFTGRGVVVGFCDTGFDPNHIAFLDSEGHSRVRRLVSYDEPKGERLIIDDPDGIAARTTDNANSWHGTHVAGIMAGGYRGNSYYGMAPDADIVGCTSKLYDAGLLAGCEDIVEYAKSVGKPAVINLSVGSYNGPHDGTSLFSQYLDLLAEDAIVCLSAGNEGTHAVHYRATFSGTDSWYRTQLQSYDWTQFNLDGMLDAWSRDSSPVAVRIAVWDNNTTEAAYVGEYHGLDGEFHVNLDMADIPELAEIYTGTIELNGYVSPYNGRWVTEAIYDVHTDIIYEPSGGLWSRYTLGFDFTGSEGTVADIFADGAGSRLSQWWGWPAGDSEMSISDLCTGRNVISVGMYTSRDSYPQLDGNVVSTGRSVGMVHSWSGYGVLDDGRILPHTVGPGDMLVSAINSVYVGNHQEDIPALQASADFNGKTYYWGVSGGTSMSCPFVAGTIACWLEANPSLTVADVKKIIELTNSHEYAEPEDPRHGQGWFNAYAGLQKVISDSGITVPGASDAGDVSAVLGDGSIEILNPGCRSVAVEIFRADGVKVRDIYGVTAPVSTVDVSALAQGVYILRLSSADSMPRSFKFRAAG